MQLPLSASALVMLGVGAVLVGAVILVVEIARRRKSASGPTRVPPDMRVPQQPGSTSGPYPATHPAAAPVAQPHVPTVEPAPAPAEREPGPAAPPAPQPLAGPVAAATPRPPEASSRVEPLGGDERIPPPWTPAAGTPAVPSRHDQAGSGRTVAAAVAQAFAVRAAAGRAGASGRRPTDPPGFDGSAAAPAEPDRAEQAPPRGVDGVDPAATADPEGIGTAAMATPAPDEPRPDVSGNGWAAPAAHGTNGDRPVEAPHEAPDGNGRAPEGSPGPDPAAGGAAPAIAAVSGHLAAGDPAPAASARADPEPAGMPAPRSDHDGAARPDEPASDVRDRLLAVLLDDPERAVGAAVELESCLRELDRLSDAVRTGRAALREVLQRLAAAGLRPDQMARLARMPLAEVEALLEPAEQQV